MTNPSPTVLEPMLMVSSCPALFHVKLGLPAIVPALLYWTCVFPPAGKLRSATESSPGVHLPVSVFQIGTSPPPRAGGDWWTPTSDQSDKLAVERATPPTWNPTAALITPVTDRLVPVATPMTGVMSVGELASTTLPLPVVPYSCAADPTKKFLMGIMLNTPALLSL